MADYIDTEGTVLKVGNGASPEVFTAIPNIVSIDGPTSSNAEKEVTNLSSSAKEFRPGLNDYGDMNMEIMWDERDTVHAGLRTDFRNRTTRNFQLIDAYSPEQVYNFTGFWKTLPLSFQPDNVVRSSAVLRVTGDFVPA